MFSSRSYKLLAVFGLLIFSGLACNMPGDDPTPTENSAILYTVAAQTLEAQMTQVASEGVGATQPEATSQPIIKATDTQPAPSKTPIPLSNTPVPTQTQT